MQEMQETQLQSLDWADPLEEEPTAVFLLEKFHGQRSLAGYSPWGRKESDMTETLSTDIYIYISVYTHTHNLGDFESTYFSLFPVLVSTLFQNNEMFFNGPILNLYVNFLSQWLSQHSTLQSWRNWGLERWVNIPKDTMLGSHRARLPGISFYSVLPNLLFKILSLYYFLVILTFKKFTLPLPKETCDWKQQLFVL